MDRVGFELGLENGADLDEFLGKWRALGLETLNQTMRIGMWGVCGDSEPTVLTIKEEVCSWAWRLDKQVEVKL